MSVGWERVFPEPGPVRAAAPARSRAGSRSWIAAVIGAAAIALMLLSWFRFAPLDNTGYFGAGYRPNSTVYAFEIENSAPIGIRITGIDLPAEPVYLGEPLVEVGEPGAFPGDVGEPRHPFKPFTLDPGAERAIILSGTTSCVPTRRGLTRTREGITVHFTVLGIPKTQKVTLDGWELNPPTRICDPPPPAPPPVFPDPTNSRL